MEAELRAWLRHAGKSCCHFRHSWSDRGMADEGLALDRWRPILILANWPYTLLGIMPTNNKLKAIAINAAGSASRAMIVRWGLLHAVRTILGIGAVLAYLWPLV
jgi:hypothetical protein